MSGRRRIGLRIAGRVQGVGYRAWLQREAGTLGLSGWVRNRRDGTVEALLEGREADLATIVAAARRGPPHAAVTSVEESRGDEGAPLAAGIAVLPTA